MGKLAVRVVCGSREVDLADWGLFYPLEEPVSDDGEFVKLRLYVKENASQAVISALHELGRMNMSAIDYENDVAGSQPVFLGVKVWDGTSLDTAFGRGWLWKRLTGFHETDAPAITYEIPGAAYDTLGRLAVITELAVICRTRHRFGQNGERIFCWEPMWDRWIGEAEGAIEPYGNGFSLEHGCYNKCVNSDFEYEADRDNGWSPSNPALTVDENTDPTYVRNGFASLLLTETGGADRRLTRSVNVGNVNSHSAQVWLRRPDGAPVTVADARLYYNGPLPTFYEALDDGWYRAYSQGFAGVNAAVEFGLEVKANRVVYADCFQLEETPRCTEYIYGDLGLGFSFSGAAHLSMSVRATGTYRVLNSRGLIPPAIERTDTTILVVFDTLQAHDGYWDDGKVFQSDSISLAYDRVNTRFTMTDGTNIANSAAVTFAKGTRLWAFAQWAYDGIRFWIYSNSGGLLTPVAFAAFACPALSASLYIGCSASGEHCGPVLDCRTWHSILRVSEMTDIVMAGLGAAELPWSRIKGSSSIIANDPSGRQNAAEIQNVPGDYPAGVKIFIQNYLEGSEPRQFYFSLIRRGVPRDDIPSKRALKGNHSLHWFEAEAGAATYDVDSATQVDATASGGNCARTTPTTTASVKRYDIPLAAEPEDLWRILGIWRIAGRFKTGAADNFYVRYRVATGAHYGPFTPEFLVDADSVWRVPELEQQVVAIPSHYVDPSDAQQYRPGDWDSSVDGVYCRLEVWIRAISTGSPVDMDGVELLANDMEGLVEVPNEESLPYLSLLMLDSIESGRCGSTVYDYDWERLLSGCDFYGWILAPVRIPAKLNLMWRNFGTGYPWRKGDFTRVWLKYRPRYRRLR